MQLQWEEFTARISYTYKIFFGYLTHIWPHLNGPSDKISNTSQVQHDGGFFQEIRLEYTDPDRWFSSFSAVQLRGWIFHSQYSRLWLSDRLAPLHSTVIESEGLSFDE